MLADTASVLSTASPLLTVGMVDTLLNATDRVLRFAELGVDAGDLLSVRVRFREGVYKLPSYRLFLNLKTLYLNVFCFVFSKSSISQI